MSLLDDRRPIRTAILRGVIVGSLGSLALGLITIAVHWASVYGPRTLSMRGVEFLYSPVLLGLLALLLGLPLLLPRRTRSLAAGSMAAGLVTLLATLACWSLAESVRRAGLRSLAEQAEPLIRAIEEHRGRAGEPPATLRALASSTLEDLPSLQYFSGAEARRKFDGNPWALSLDTPTGLANRDRFLYLPLGNYLQAISEGRVEPIAGWAYVHD